MTPSRTYAAAGLLVTLLGSLAGLAVAGASPAGAATRTVTLTGSGPTLATVTIRVGDAVTFTNADQLGVSHVVSSAGPAWSYGPTTVPGGASVTSAPFGSPGTYGYTDRRSLLGTDAAGAIVVTSPAPAASPIPDSSPAATAPSRQPAVALPAASASPDGSPAPAGVPGALPAASPTPPPSAPASPEPSSPDPTGSPAVGPAAVKGSVNNSNHQQAYGLPAALAVVLIGGVLSLVVRLLLACPAGRRQPG